MALNTLHCKKLVMIHCFIQFKLYNVISKVRNILQRHFNHTFFLILIQYFLYFVLFSVFAVKDSAIQINTLCVWCFNGNLHMLLYLALKC